jgi:phosphoglycolate phosphatase
MESLNMHRDGEGPNDRLSRARARCMYVDLDGTLLGRGASLLRDGEGSVSIEGVRAIQACMRADVEVVLMSGRRRAQVYEDARLLGQSSYIYEAGACVVLDGEEQWLTGDLVPGELSIAEQIEHSGAPALLLERYAGRLEYHEPWHTEREVSHLFRGLVDAFEVDALLQEHGHGDLRLVDNGVVNRRSPALAELPHVRGYHLLPAGASKAGGVACLASARAGVCPGGDLRGRRLARGPRVRDAGGDVLAGGKRRGPRSVDPRGAGEARERARVRGRTRRGRLRGGCGHPHGLMMPSRFSSS